MLAGKGTGDKGQGYRAEQPLKLVLRTLWVTTHA